MSIYYANSASSWHSGGLNFAFADGSVRFVKNSISSWTFNGGSATGQSGVWLPIGVTWASYLYTINPGCQLGVYQALATRAGGEVVDANSY